MQIRSVGIIGAGQMGSGIAHVVALHGYDVVIHDMAPERLKASLDNVTKNLNRQVSRGHIDQAAMDAALKKIRTSDKLADVGLTNREACYNPVRNVTACPWSGLRPNEIFDVRPGAPEDDASVPA